MADPISTSSFAFFSFDLSPNPFGFKDRVDFLTYADLFLLILAGFFAFSTNSLPWIVFNFFYFLLFLAGFYPKALSFFKAWAYPLF